jgi:predicted transcriptional regulator
VLGGLGINEFDERVYRVFLAGPGKPVQDIATDVGAPVSRVRHAVARLESLGLLRRIAHGHYTPVGPQTALTALLNQRRMESEQALAAVQGVVDELSDEYRAGRPVAH